MATVQAVGVSHNAPTDALKVEYPVWRTRLLFGLSAVTLLGMFVMLYMAFFYAGTDAVQGHAQRLFYMHVSSYAGGSVAFFVTVIAGIAYLVTRNAKWDRLAVSSVEVGLPMMTVCLVTGSAWARPIWNTWWTADPRLNGMAIMWLLYAAYLVLRGAIEDPDRRARFAAIYGILAFASVVYVFLIPRVRDDTLHPVVIGPSVANPMAEGGFEVRTDPRIGATMGVAMTWWCVAAVVLIWHRLRLENTAARLQALKARFLAQQG
ncbi:MAG: cytochrome C assembly protein [Candidatus Thermofonsia Clade 1 bacterium]|uniref:Heme exporter protein C n=1 Tax=Candidatus Thermofonsia Clade 1 bacterium TaxID=2364210 RepID=A0A2M8NYZ4_9CHLR|nr:MAG: cytochrome C assembly protein [Candidatus Thermofonsia Clade 1 bacterium]